MNGKQGPYLPVPGGEIKLAFEGACCVCPLKSVAYELGIRQKLVPIHLLTDVTVEGVRLSQAALDRAALMYRRYTSLGAGASMTAASRVISLDGPVPCHATDLAADLS